MKLYYLQSQYTVGKNRIVKVLFDADVSKENLSTLSPYNILSIDETLASNNALCIDLVNTCNKIDNVGENKYYISNGSLYQKNSWAEYIISPL